MTCRVTTLFAWLMLLLSSWSSFGAIDGGSEPLVDDASDTTRFDYPLSGLIQSAMDSIAATDERILADLIDQIRDDGRTSNDREKYEKEVIAWLLRKVSQSSSADDVNNRIVDIWNREPKEDWTWNGLLALVDILDRLKLSEHEVRVAICAEMKIRVSLFENAYHKGAVSRNELSERAKGCLNRLLNPRDAIAQCQTLLRLVPEDFPLATFLVSKLHTLPETERGMERDARREAVDRCLTILRKDSEQNERHPLAFAKLLLEKADTEFESNKKMSYLEEADLSCQRAKELIKGMDSDSLKREARRLKLAPLDLATYRWHQLRTAISTEKFNLASSSKDDKIEQALQLANRCKALTELHRKYGFSEKSILPTTSTFLRALSGCSNVDTEEFRRLFAFAVSVVPKRDSKQVDVPKQIEEIQLALSELRIKLRDNGFREITTESIKQIVRNSKEETNVARGIVDLGMLYIGEGSYEDAKLIGKESQRSISTYEENLIVALAEIKLGQYEEAKTSIGKNAFVSPKYETTSEPRTIRARMMTKLIRCELQLQSRSEDDKLEARMLADELAHEIKKANQALPSSEMDAEFLGRIGTENQNHQAMIRIAISPKDSKTRDEARQIWEKQLGDRTAFVSYRAAYFLALLRLADLEDENRSGDYQQAVLEYESQLLVFNNKGGTDTGEFSKLKLEHDRLKSLHSSKKIVKADLDEEITKMRGFLLEIEKLGREAYPNLRYNVHCLLLQLYGYSEVLEEERIIEDCRLACSIGLRLRELQSTTTELKENLFAKYRVAFDHSVPMLARMGKYHEAIQLASWTTNRAIEDLSLAKEANDDVVPDLSLPNLPRQFLAYYVGENSIEVFWRLSGTETRHDSISIKRHKLDREISNLLSQFERYSQREEQDSNTESSLGLGLSRALVPEGLIKDLKRRVSNECLYILPHGPLFRIPFEALPVWLEDDTKEKSVQYLFDLLPPTIYLQTLRPTIERKRTDQPSSRSTIQTSQSAGHESIALGNFGGELGWSRIARATKQLLLEELKKGHSILHIGAHGSSQSASIEVWNKEEMGMGEILAIKDQVRIHSDLVFLSACESQQVNLDAIQFGGNTHKAIGTTFLILGAENVIASYWKVQAKSAEVIALKTLLSLPALSSSAMPQKEIAYKLHAAKMLLREDPSLKLDNPYHWAAFCLTALRIESTGLAEER